MLKEIKKLSGHTHWVNCLAVLPDGCYENATVSMQYSWSSCSLFDEMYTLWCSLASCSDDKTMIIWDIKIKTLFGHAPVNCLVVLPDGSLASCSKDKSMIRL